MKNKLLQFGIVAAIMMLVLSVMGRVLWCSCGELFLWSSEVHSMHNSQHLLDAYSFSHFQHGLFFYFVLWSIGYVSFLPAIILEACWEILENTPFTIERYRAATFSLHYYGDSILNSFGDLATCAIGFYLASKLPWKVMLAVYLIVEISMLVLIRDSLTLNVIMLIHPLDVIKKLANSLMSTNDETRYFYELTPEKILSAVEETGLQCTGRILTLNSMENRVYEVEIDIADESKIKSVSEKFRVSKFYRPGRWTKEQILEEHQFLLDLKDQDIPVITPLPFEDGQTLKKLEGLDIYFAVFPKCGGRIPEEFNDQQLEIIGRLLARLHNIGASKKFKHRLELSPESYGLKNLDYLISTNCLPLTIKASYEAVVKEISKICEEKYRGLELIRIHGDCHLANILWGNEGPFLVDFDDTLSGPPVQDLWLILPGRDEEAKRQLDVLLNAYESMRRFDRKSLALIEALRALRIIHFSAWIARRWKDPAFQRAFTEFGSERYWQEQLATLKEQLSLISV